MSDACDNFANALNRVIDDQEELIIAREGGGAVVVMSLDQWNSMKETLHVLGSPANARRLLDSAAQLDQSR